MFCQTSQKDLKLTLPVAEALTIYLIGDVNH